jgi:hypothetical protein
MKKPKLPSAEIDFLKLNDPIEESGSNSALSDGLVGLPQEMERDINMGLWFQSAISGMWYHNEKAAGDISSIKLNGILYEKAC